MDCSDTEWSIAKQNQQTSGNTMHVSVDRQPNLIQTSPDRFEGGISPAQMMYLIVYHTNVPECDLGKCSRQLTIACISYFAILERTWGCPLGGAIPKLICPHPHSNWASQQTGAKHLGCFECNHTGLDYLRSHFNPFKGCQAKMLILSNIKCCIINNTIVI